MLLSPQEKLLFQDGYERLAGIDEAGRGSLVGPVVAAVAMLKRGNFFWLKKFSQVSDSKLLSEKKREEIFEKIKAEPRIIWRTAAVSERLIDRLNIWQATVLAWRRCLNKISPQPSFLFIDGNLGLSHCLIEQKPVIAGDGKIFVLALASIIAKVTRDHLIRKLAPKYPGYDLARHKGYATKFHLEKLKQFTPSLIHRKSFRPVFELLPFRERVYQIVSRIPAGQVMTYQQVAEQVGQPGACRAVGSALNQSNGQIPCHRVVRADGRLGGYNRGAWLKELLLKKEKAI